MVEPINETICPFCRESNQCQAYEADCWCNQVVIPQDLLDLVPQSRQRKACICRDCISAYQNDPMRFSEIYG